jgi:hypothetical protein
VIVTEWILQIRGGHFARRWVGIPLVELRRLLLERGLPEGPARYHPTPNPFLSDGSIEGSLKQWLTALFYGPRLKDAGIDSKPIMGNDPDSQGDQRVKDDDEPDKHHQSFGPARGTTP